MINRQYFTLKFTSTFLKEKKYNLHMDFEEALLGNKVIALADNQILRLIRAETKRKISLEIIEEWYKERDFLKKQKNSIENRTRIRELQTLIYDFMYIPEYITVVVDADSHYTKLFEKGLMFNGKKYVRTSCSASQGRMSTVVFVEEEVSKIILQKMDNGRDLTKPLVPSKYNAYLGTYGSATKLVSTPRVCIIPDCFEKRTVRVNWVTEINNPFDDDKIDVKDVEIEFNLFDGNGLISPQFAQRWAEELGLDYLPAQWCVRAPFIKGMLSVFDFVEFAKETNNENYNVKTLYGEIFDIRNADAIITESQFKLWDSYKSYEDYESNCIENGLGWGVSLQTPEFDKDVLELNYQFLQALNLSDKDVVDLCDMSVKYFEGVSSDNILYTILFLLGKHLDISKIEQYLKSSDNYWVNALMFDHNLINDPYIREKIYDSISARIKDACIGKILVEGNFQVIVPDSYAFMQHACGLQVTGLLNEGEFYSKYWTSRNVETVDAMRSPLTHISEHNIVKIVDSDEISKWFKYYYTGLVANCHDEHTLKFSGSDYDYDIIATTSNPIMINGVHKDQFPITYQPPKAEKMIINPWNLYQSDLFTFGSIIGSITNKTTNIYSLLPLFKKDSVEYEILMNRLKMGCKLQSAQIDKAKIGREVKGIPGCWVEYQKIKDEDDDDVIEWKNLNNSLLCDKHPYFFIYLYRETHKKYRNYYNGYNKMCKVMFKMDLEQLKNLKRRTTEQRELLDNFNKYLPVVDSDCEMNRICHYMESINFNIKSKLKTDKLNDFYRVYTRELTPKNDLNYRKVLGVVQNLQRVLKVKNDTISIGNKKSMGSELKDLKNNLIKRAKEDLNEITSDVFELTNYLVEIFYKDYPSYNKSILFQLCGKHMVENVKFNKGNKVYVPIRDVDGELNFLNQKYRVELVEVN